MTLTFWSADAGTNVGSVNVQVPETFVTAPERFESARD